MAALVGVDFVLGVAALVFVPFGRGSGLVPVKGRSVYLAHSAVGIALGVGALWLVLRHGTSGQRITRLAARLGLAGVIVGALGGLLAVEHGLRLGGMGLMLVGALMAGLGYLMPSLEAHDEKERAQLQGRA